MSAPTPDPFAANDAAYADRLAHDFDFAVEAHATSADSDLTADQASVLDLVLAGEMSMSYALRYARRTGQDAFADYLAGF